MTSDAEGMTCPAHGRELTRTSLMPEHWCADSPRTEEPDR